MAQTAQIDILINAANSAKTLGELDKALSDINSELKNIPIGSEAFKQLKTQADATSKTINNINITGFEKQVAGFEATSKTISSSLSLATGTMALFGSESEETAKILAKVQGALAISTAFKDFTEAQKAADASGKGLNKTLLGNPFVLIAAVLLPLILEMEEFKVILDLVGGVFKDIMKALKPLLDAFMMLLNSVMKALVPIIKVFADILVKTLNPIMKVISKVLEALNPLFQELGTFLSENTVLIDVLTGALQLALLPLTLLIEGLELLGVVDASTNLNETASAAEITSDAFDNLKTSYENLETAQNNYLNEIDKEIALAQAQGRSIKEIQALQDKKFKAEQDQARKRLAYLNSLRTAYKLTADQEKALTTEIAKTQAALDTSLTNQQLETARRDKEARTAASEASKKATEELKKTQAEIQKSYLELRRISEEINFLFVPKEQEPFVGFFQDIAKRYSEGLSKVAPEFRDTVFSSLVKSAEQIPTDLFLFENLVKSAEGGLKGVEEFVSDFTNQIIIDIQRVGNAAVEKLLEGGKGFGDPEVQRLTGQIQTLTDALKQSFRVISGDASVFTTLLNTNVDDATKELGFYIDFFSKQLTRLNEGFDFSVEEIGITFDFLRNSINENIEAINKKLSDPQNLTIIQRERLETQKKILAEFLSNYQNSISNFNDQQILDALGRPLGTTLERIFDDLRTNINAFNIELLENAEEYRRVGAAVSEFVEPVARSLVRLGVEAERVNSLVGKLTFRTLKDFLIAQNNLFIKEAERITTSDAKRNRLLKLASETRIRILREEAKEAERLANEETNRIIRKKQREAAAGIISEEEADETISENKQKIQRKLKEVLTGINKEIEDETQSESLRGIQRFAEGFGLAITSIQTAAQAASDILANISQQALINLQANFDGVVKNLEAAKNQGLLTQKEFDFERLKAEERYDKRRRQIEKAAFERQYAAQLFQSITGTALAVVNALAQFPGPPATIPASILAGVLGAAQVAVIASQPKPRFRKGGLVGGQTPGDSDTITANISPGEFIVNSQAAKRFLPVLKQINQFDRPTIGGRETVASPPINSIGASEPVRAYVVLDELNEKNELLNRIQNNNSFFSTT